MPQSFYEFYYHIIWATKEREPSITPNIEEILKEHIPYKTKMLGGTPIALNMVENHLHLLASVPPKISIADLPAHLAAPKERKAINTVSGYFPAYKHKNPIFEGLQKGNKLYNSQYTTFRRVSDKSAKSAKNSWIHPGFAAYDLMGKALITLEDQLEATIDATAKEFVLG